MLKIDCHIHTYPKSACSVMSPEDAVDAAVKAGMDGIVITEHDYLWRADEIEELGDCTEGKLKLFSSIEVACREGHFLVFGLKNMTGIYFEMPVEELIQLAHRSSAAIIAAHPYRYNRDMGDYCYELDIDGVEIDSNNTGEHSRALAEELAEKKKIFKLVASDAHSTDVVGKYFTSFPDSVHTIEDLASFVIENKNKALL